jgi:hypothetical protein
MSRISPTLRKQLRVRPLIAAACAFALGALLAIAPVLGDDGSAPRAVHYIQLDDVSNLVMPTPETPEGVGVPSADGSHGNNGHGNNADGVDSSNPGKGGTGNDDSCDGTGPCIDDEN